MTELVELRSLSKRFGDLTTVNDITAIARPGEVTALLGPNGAGKTTTLRMLLGLIEPTSGTATIGGQRYAELGDPVRTVGAVLESAGCDPGRSALDHLRIIALAAGLPKSAPQRVLTETGLADDAKRRVGQYSLGMRQRLGLAAGLLGDPKVLVLDEPTNGLDPPGVRWLRGYVRRLADEGRTVLLSSHVLSEVEQTADHVLVLSHGRLVRSATLDDLRAAAGLGARVRTQQPGRLVSVLEAAGHTCRHVGDDIAVDAAPEQVGELAAAHQVVLYALAGTGGLEQAFFDLIDQAEPTEQPGEVLS